MKMVNNKNCYYWHIRKIFGIAWIISWFGAIWMRPYSAELFFTGLFALILAVLFHISASDESFWP